MLLVISEGEDRSQVTSEVEALLDCGWVVQDNGSSLQKTFYFKTYTKVMDFHQVNGVRSKSKNHHATMTSKAGSLTVNWTTHNPPGLSLKDTFMARYCDDQAQTIGMVAEKDAHQCGPSNKM